MKKFSRAWACATLVPVVIMTVLAGCSGPNPFQAAKAASSTTVADSGTQTTDLAGNPFIPDRNVSDCIGTNERPNCGTSKKGGVGMWLTFGALILGVGFVMWRISVSVRRRDAGTVKPQGNTF
jgi:hypothetical protein